MQQSVIRFNSGVGLTVKPGAYVLIKLSGGADGQPLPLTFFDLSISPVPISLSAAGGEVGLLRPGRTIPFTGCPTAQSGVADYVGYGTGINCSEGAAAPAPTLTTSLARAGGGCADTDNNLLDFRTGVPNPRSFSTAPAPCAATTPTTSAFNFASPQFDTFEGAGRAQVLVTRAGDLSAPASVDYATIDGTATERSDYTTALGTLDFAPGESQKSFDVLVTDDAIAEANETVGLTLSNAKGADLGVRASATLVIHDNDLSAATTNPLDTSSFYAQQHYYDFLSRLPDSSGLQFWTQNIESCGADAQCREVKRVDTSAAFFLSIEFQQTGFLVYRLYKAALPETTARPRAMPRYREFMRDTQQAARGVVVGQDDWQQKLEANTLALLDDFVARPEFLAAYPAQLSPADFVAKLNAQAGGPLSPTESTALVAGLLAGTETRASVLRKVAEDEDFNAAEKNRAFVLMQYFGYLRRNPDDAPDSDFSGYDFWLSKLDQFGGNYRQAEMVKAFISSAEYRSRFGTP
jgi:Calx-beta domain